MKDAPATWPLTFHMFLTAPIMSKSTPKHFRDRAIMRIPISGEKYSENKPTMKRESDTSPLVFGCKYHTISDKVIQINEESIVVSFMPKTESMKITPIN